MIEIQHCIQMFSHGTFAERAFVVGLASPFLALSSCERQLDQQSTFLDLLWKTDGSAVHIFRLAVKKQMDQQSTFLDLL